MAETGWTKPSSIQCFDDWFRREDFGDRDQLERCWANAQNVAARDRNATALADAEQLTRLREAARNADEALQLIQGFDFALDNSAHGQEIRRRAIAAIDGLREALAQRNTGGR